MNRGFIDGTQGANKKIKVFPRCLKIDSFNWLIKNKNGLNWWNIKLKMDM
jgi:hypothetical protein